MERIIWRVGAARGASRESRAGEQESSGPDSGQCRAHILATGSGVGSWRKVGRMRAEGGIGVVHQFWRVGGGKTRRRGDGETRRTGRTRGARNLAVGSGVGSFDGTGMGGVAHQFWRVGNGWSLDAGAVNHKVTKAPSRWCRDRPLDGGTPNVMGPPASGSGRSIAPDRCPHTYLLPDGGARMRGMCGSGEKRSD
jgi:hypothetical protein